MRNLLLLTITALLIVSCQQRPASYEVKGTLPDGAYSGKTIYMLRFNDDVFIDSTVVTGQDFVFKGVVDSPAICRIDIGQLYASFVLENEVYDINFNSNNATSISALNTEYNRLNTGTDSLRILIDTRIQELEALTDDPAELDKLQQECFQKEFKPATIDFYKSFFLANKNNEVGTSALVNYSYYVTPDELDEMIAEAGEWVLSRNNIKYLIKNNNALKNTVAGKPFVDFTIEQEDGSSVSLSDYVGKGNYVLVDFWASWCGPCIQETPIIAEVYNKYKKKNFEVLGVAVWDKPDHTKEAIEKHNITWPQIINAQTVPTELYGIDGIPYIILFAPDGTIAARDLRGEGLKAKVAEVMKN